MSNQEVSGQFLPVNKLAVRELQDQRELLADFVRSQLKEASFVDSRSSGYGEGDYGIIPGTKKRCLFKPGAEKLLRLFGLGVRFTNTDKTIDRANNFALYTYKAEVYVIKNSVIVAECEATANSQEIKYKEKTEWKKNAKGIGESTKVETPIFDILNTLQKMAQKRALIGATLLATGGSEYFTQDILDGDEPLSSEPEKKEQAQEVKRENNSENASCPKCSNTMMVSMYPNKQTGEFDFYCKPCKLSVPRT